LAAHLHLEIKETEFHVSNSNLNILIFMKRIVKFKKLKRLAAHLEEAHGTLVRRGTPVEKH